MWNGVKCGKSIFRGKKRNFRFFFEKSGIPQKFFFFVIFFSKKNKKFLTFFFSFKLLKGYFPPKIDIQTRISGVPHINQNFTLISNLHTVFYLVAYF
jgi:hypothetical protein